MWFYPFTLRMKLKILLFSIVVVHVEAVAEEHSFGARAGMLGLGLEYSYTLSERLAIRGGFNGSSYSFDQTESGIDYEFDIDWQSVSVALDFHPNNGPLRLSVGILKNDNSLLSTSNVSENVTVGGTTYKPTDVGTLRGAVGFDTASPLISIGWDWSRENRVGVSFDMGVVSQGPPTVSLLADGGLLDDPMFAADLAAEETELRNSFEDLELLPFIALGLMYRF